MTPTDPTVDLLTACRVLDQRRLVEAFGHVSARLDSQRVVITPARALRFAAADNLLTFDLGAGEQIGGPAGIAPLEVPMHLEVYRSRPDVGCICRTHSFHAGVLGALAQPVRAAHGFGGMLGRIVPVHDDGDLVTTPEAGRAVARSLGEAAAVLLRGNGCLVTGSNVREACVRAIYLEEAARIQVIAAPLGSPRHFSDDELAARSRWYGAELVRAWDYYSHLPSGRDRSTEQEAP